MLCDNNRLRISLCLASRRQLGARPTYPSKKREVSHSRILDRAIQAGLARTPEVKLPSLNRRFLIALHSPLVLVKTGLGLCSPEKTLPNAPRCAYQVAFSGPV